MADLFDAAVVEPIVDFLAALAGDGRALELGIGTGRIALPLAAGLRSSGPWEDRTRQPFTHEIRQHVSVWEK